VPTTQSYMWVLRTGAWKNAQSSPSNTSRTEAGQCKEAVGRIRGCYVTTATLIQQGAWRNALRLLAHVRRKFEEAKPGSPGKRARPTGFQYCQQLFAMERDSRTRPGGSACSRQILAKPILDEFWNGSRACIPCRHSARQAVGYVTGKKRSSGIPSGRAHPDLQQPAENAIRPFVVGRKNCSLVIRLRRVRQR
jgi:hypothetical protein